MLILRKPWNSQPPPAAQAHLNSALGRLIFLYYGATTHDQAYVWGATGTPSATIEPRPDGVGLSQSQLSFELPEALTVNSNLTAVGVARLDALNPSADIFKVSSLSDLSDSYMRVSMSTNELLRVSAKQTGQTERGSNVLTAYAAGQRIQFCAAFRGSASRSVFTDDGRSITNSAGSGGVGSIQYLQVGTAGQPIAIQMLALYAPDALPTDDLLSEVARTPWSTVFVPRSIDIPTSAGGAGAFTLTASAGSFTLAGQSATLLKSKALGAAAGSFALAGQSANLVKGRTLTADAGAFSLAGQSATLLKSKVVAANAGAFVLAGQAATLKADRKLTAAAGSFALSGQAATLTYSPLVGYTLTASAGAFTLAGQSATLLRSKVLPAAVGAFSFSGQAATLTHTAAGSYSLTANVGSFTITGSAAQLLRGYRLAATAGAFSLAGSAAGLLTGRRLVAAAAAYAFTGSDATLTHSAAAASYTLSASVGAFAFSGVAVTFRFNRQLTGQAGAFVLSGGSATLTNSGAIFTTSEHWRYTFPVDDMRYAMPVDDMRHTFPSGGLTYNFGE